MAKQQPKPQARPAQAAQPVRKPAAAPVRRPSERKENIFTAGSREFIYGKKNFITMGIGLGLIILGLMLMAGGGSTDPNQWDAGQIYSARRITVAPICMVAGFIVVIVGIFQKNSPAAAASTEKTIQVETSTEA